MSTQSADLAQIRTFPQLVRYLRDELDWPIESEDFEDLTFDFTPEELGIDTKVAAKIQEIKRLRPLSVNQPWGVFFVKFEPKRLPVIALRRILSSVALKKRASANPADRVVWEPEDLLFISSYGEGQARQITFAHFSHSPDGENLPTLKVLGWDNLDTLLHIGDVANTLHRHLLWPEDDADVEAWRENWRSAFTLRHREVISTSRELSIRLAELARAIRDRIRTVLAIETERGPLTKLMNASREALVHDLDPDGFADMYAQTIAYGLLSARIANPRSGAADAVPMQMPVTNPFLKELMDTFLRAGGRRGKRKQPGIDFDELGVSEVVELLDNANMEAVVRDFGDRNPQEDPVIHFYELFLKAYDARKRMQRGVFYTPRPVVSFIVRSVDRLLREEFGLEDGLADTASWGEMAMRHKGLSIPDGVKPSDVFVRILDPATGTGTFLVEVIDTIYQTMKTRWATQGHNTAAMDALWNDYVPTHLLPRIHGFELMMAPYAIAHLKVGLKLRETGYRFGSVERVRVFLTNSLEAAHDSSGQLAIEAPALAHEAETVNAVKRNQRFTVLVGNPPYANFGQLNRIPFILGLLDEYKQGLGERKLNLDDDFIKFIRLAHYLIARSGVGVIGFITNNSYLDGVTHRGMRRSLLTALPEGCIVNLHGSARRGEVAPDGSRDENVFDIQQGVAVSLFAAPPKRRTKKVAYGDVWGVRARKYAALLGGDIPVAEIPRNQVSEDLCLFVPQDLSLRDDYGAFASLSDVFQFAGQGIQTKQDGFALQSSRAKVAKIVSDLKSLTIKQLSGKYAIPISTPSWSIAWAMADVKSHPGKIVRVVVKPFDSLWTYYTGHSNGFLARPRRQATDVMLESNIALVAKRQTKESVFSSVFVVEGPINEGLFSIDPKGRETVFPLWVAGSDDSLLSGGRVSNIKPLVRSLRDCTGEEFFHFAYAVLHSPTYRSNYADFLKTDYPRVPLPPASDLFQRLVGFGVDLVDLHLMRTSPPVRTKMPSYMGPDSPEVGRIGWSNEMVMIDAPAARKEAPVEQGTAGFRGVPEIVWDFHIGGYRVCEKWLKDRKGRTLSKDDILHYQRIVAAISETIRLMGEIDDVIEQYGGWPGAFASS